MPRSKRDKQISLTQTAKKDKAHKGQLITTIREQAEAFQYLWVFDVQHMRNIFLQQVRTAWKGSRIFLGRNAVMRKALGATAEDECRLGVHKIANLLEGDRGLLFTNSPPEEVLDWFEDYKQADYARTGNVVDDDFVLPEGPIMIGDVQAPHSIEPQFRKLGLKTYLVKGVPTLKAEHVVCKKGDTLNPNQVNLLQLFGKTMSTFQIVPRLGVNVTDGTIIGGTDAASMKE